MTVTLELTTEQLELLEIALDRHAIALSSYTQNEDDIISAMAKRELVRVQELRVLVAIEVEEKE